MARVRRGARECAARYGYVRGKIDGGVLAGGVVADEAGLLA